MRICLVSIGSKPKREKSQAEESLTAEYLQRANRLAPTEGLWVPTEAAFWARVVDSHARTTAKVILMDAHGSLLTSNEFADHLRDLRDRGSQQLVVGIGGADGWSPESLSRSDLTVSMGRMTLPHSLARVVASEQIYRAMTILAGHPYHSGH